MSFPSPTELREACQDMPLFPLPNISLIPYTALRLHVFEPRYVQLLKDVMETNRLMAIPCFSNGWEARSKRPDVEAVAGVGKVVQMKELPDNRYLIVLVGVGRLLILGEHEQQDLYRRAYGELLLEPEDETEKFGEMRELFVQLLMTNSELSDNLQPLLEEGIRPVHMCNALGNILLQESERRQQFLCSETLGQRCEMVISEIVELLLHSEDGFDA